jgi:hypothetical protein
MARQVIVMLKGIDLKILRDDDGSMYCAIDDRLPNGKKSSLAPFEIDGDAKMVRALQIIGQTSQTLDKSSSAPRAEAGQQ